MLIEPTPCGRQLLPVVIPGVTTITTVGLPFEACVIAKSDMDKDVGVQLEDLPQSFGNPHYGGISMLELRG